MANGAYAFTGVNGITYPHQSALDAATDLTIAFRYKPQGGANNFCLILSQWGDATSGPGTFAGFGIWTTGFNDDTVLAVDVHAFPSGSAFGTKRTNSGALVAGAWNDVVIRFKGGEADEADRVELHINGSRYTGWATDSADAPTTLGVNDQPLTVACDVESGSPGNYVIGQVADVGLLYGRALDDTDLADYFTGKSIGFYVAAGDFWASYRTDANDENGGATATLVHATGEADATLTDGPAIEYPASGSTYTLTADPGSVAVTGTNAGLRRGLRIAVASASVTVTGASAALRRALKIGAAAASVTVTGTTSTLRATRRLNAGSASCTITGTAANLRRGLRVNADSGAITVSGQPATLRYSGAAATYTLTADPTSITVTGSAATLRRTYALPAVSGSLAITGINAALRAARSLIGAPSAITVTGASVNLRVGRRLAAGPTSIVITTSPAALRAGRGLHADTVTYSLTFADAVLRASFESDTITVITLKGRYAPTVIARGNYASVIRLVGRYSPVISLVGRFGQ